MIRESILFRPLETGLPFFMIREICINLRVISEPTIFVGIKKITFLDI